MVMVLFMEFVAQGQSLQFSFDLNGNVLTQSAHTVAPPQILDQPQMQLAAPGESATFIVVPADVSGLTYQWRFNGTNLPGATSDTLLLTNVSFTNEGPYSAVLANPSGSVTSLVTHLYIDSRGVGMPDSWQLAYFGNLNQNPSGDFDGDGVNNLQEFLDGTNPTNAASTLYRITLFDDGGTVVVVPNQTSYTNGQVVTLTASGSAAVPFHAWTGDVVTRSNTITVTMNTNLNLFARFQPFTLNWTNTVSGDWNVAANWYPNLVPGSNENVVIVNQALTVTLNGSADLNDFTLGGANVGTELDVAGRLTIAGVGTWEGGTMGGSGTTLVLPGASFTIINVSALTLSGRTLENAGTMTWMGGNLTMSGGVITNDSGSQFALGSSGSFTFGSGTPRFDNSGTLVTAANAITTFNGVVFDNYGTVTIPGGSLSMSGGGIQNGTIPVPAGTTLNFAAGTFTSSASLSITGAGTLIVSGGTANLAGMVNVSGTNLFSNGTANLTGNYTCIGNTELDILGGTANFNGSGTVAPNILNLNGSLGGGQTVTVGSVLNWSGGSMNGSGRTVIQPGAALNIAAFTGYGGVYLYDRTLENAGTAVWGGGNFGMSGVITNDAGASFQILNAAAFSYAGNTPRFDNAGTFLPSPSGTTAFNGPLFDNYGAVNLVGGILLFNSAYSGTANSILNYYLSGNSAGTNYGQIQAANSFVLSGTLAVSLTNHFIPFTNETFTILTASTRAGAFASFTYPTNAVSMILSNTPTSASVQVTGVTLQPTNLPVAPGIISWWRSENDALDSAGTNNGTLTNGTSFTTGIVGQSFLLDGVADYVTIPDSASLRPTSVTLEAWVKIYSTNGTELIFAKPLGPGTLDSYGLAIQNGAPLAAICDNSGFGTFISGSPLALGQWYHLAFTFDNASQQEALYVNGVAVATASAGKSMSYDSHPLLLGADIENGVPSYFLNGQIDEATIYSRALGAGEIAAIYNVGSLGKQVLSAYQRWKLAHLNDVYAPDLGDPDGDGYPTLLEYGLAMFPEIADLPGLPPMNLYDYGAGDKRLRVMLHRDPTHNDVTIQVQASSNLLNGWQNVAGSTNGLPFQGVGYVGGDGSGAGIKTVEIRDSSSVTNASQRFLRIKVTH